MHTLTVEKSSFSISNKFLRVIWKAAFFMLFRPFGLNIFRSWRCQVLRIFGARIGRNSNIHASVKIWAPWNLKLGENSSIGPHVDVYNQGKITIGKYTIISQKTYICASTHDFTRQDFPLICKDIYIGDLVWIAADAFIGPGKRIGDGAVVAARSSVFKNVESWTVVGGNPSKFIKKRNLEN